jgi:hypothetical protein
VQILNVDDICTGGFTQAVDPNSGGMIFTCQRGTPSADTPSGCVATINGSSTYALPSSGGNVTLNVTCTSPTTGLTYKWLRAGLSASTSQSWQDTLQANSNTSTVTTSYQVQVCNGTACTTVPAAPLTATVQGATSSTPPPSSGWNGSCPGFDSTKVLVENWANPSRLYTSDAGGFGPNDVLVVQINTGSGTSTSLGRIGGAETGSTPTKRLAVLSTTPCDFGPQPALGASSAGTSVTVRFYVNQPGAITGTLYPVIPPNSTVYLNVMNIQPPGCASSGNCGMFIDFSKPSGL